MSRLTKLFEPLHLGSLELPNRIVFPAITTLYDTHYDLKGDEHSAYFYAERAQGGAGLLIIGALQALYPGRREHRVAINSDRYIDQLRVWTKAVHDNGGKAAAQLAIWNYWAKEGAGTPAEDVSPSGVVTVQGDFRGVVAVSSDTPTKSRDSLFIPESRPLTVKEIHMIEGQIGNAAARAVEANFDAIELPVIMGNLLHRFMTPFTNRRTDEYGGSLENRLRMLLETIAIIRRRVGNDFPLICRLSGEDLMPWGLKLDDYKEIAPMIEKAGVDALSIFPGWYETKQPRVQMCVPRGAFVYLAEGIKHVVDIPVAANIRINDPLLAEQILAEDKADLIVMGRALIADPDLPNKAKEGRLEDVRLCTGCCKCYDSINYGGGEPLTCSVNARAGKEAQYIITPAMKPKKVFVIGGGPAGMEAARVAGLRGHRVTLFEKKDKPGGQLLPAAIPPYKEEWNSFIKYLTSQLQKLRVEVRLNEEATARVVEDGSPDVVVVATGAVSLIPEIPGIDGGNVATAIDVLLGNKEVGQNVAVVGGGLVGCETAEFLYRRGNRITILEMLPCIGADIGLFDKGIVLDRLTQAGIRMLTNTKVEEITEKGVRATCNGSSEFFEADSVVIAAGMKVDDSLGKELQGKVPSLYRIGACVEPRRVRQAVEEGFQVGLSI